MSGVSVRLDFCISGLGAGAIAIGVVERLETLLRDGCVTSGCRSAAHEPSSRSSTPMGEKRLRLIGADLSLLGRLADYGRLLLRSIHLHLYRALLATLVGPTPKSDPNLKQSSAKRSQETIETNRQVDESPPACTRTLHARAHVLVTTDHTLRLAARAATSHIDSRTAKTWTMSPPTALASLEYYSKFL